jgi:hypothetical protein
MTEQTFIEPDRASGLSWSNSQALNFYHWLNLYRKARFISCEWSLEL